MVWFTGLTAFVGLSTTRFRPRANNEVGDMAGVRKRPGISIWDPFFGYWTVESYHAASNYER